MDDYKGTIDYLYGLQRHGIKLGLRNITELLRRLGDPQEAFASAHIAGTNGKGSTAHALVSILKASGARAGLFTSPHLVSFTERMEVDGAEIPEEDVIRLARKVREAAGEMNPTFFEVVTAMGFLYFAEKAVEWAVVETGMGGRLDATNSLSPRVTIITPVALDHAEFLGSTLEEVAREKAGIIKENAPVVVAPQGPEAMRVIRARAGEMKAPLHVAGEDFAFSITNRGAEGLTFDYSSGSLALNALRVPLVGDYQALNASLAVRAFELVAGDAGEGAVREGLLGMRPPGRLELIRHEPPVYLDGAHNPAAAEALARALEGLGMRPVMVIGVMGDKDVEGILAPLLPLAEGAIFASPGYGRSAPAERLLGSARALGYEGETAPTVREALEAALARGKPVLVTGSFFTIGEAKEALLGAAPSRIARLGEWQAAP
jgi:dihydrofolate synthase/folylpolyglutamate synthase